MARIRCHLTEFSRSCAAFAKLERRLAKPAVRPYLPAWIIGGRHAFRFIGGVISLRSPIAEIPTALVHRFGPPCRRTSFKRTTIEMNTKLVIAVTVAALSLATTAFAGEGGNSPAMPNGYDNGQGTSNQSQVVSRFDNTVLPANGAEGAVQTANSLPKGAMDGTGPELYARSVTQWFAQQADHRFALRQPRQARQAHLNG